MSAAADSAEGRVFLVTGASSGIGKQTALELARRGGRVVLACRNAERGEAARSEIAAQTNNAGVELMLVDLSRRASIREFAQAFRRRFPSLDVLVNNAGTWSSRRRETDEGTELTWATNVLGYFLLTQELVELLRRSAPARVVNVASQLAGDLDLGDVEFRRRHYSGVSAYSQSKQADRMLTWALARRLEDSGVTANAMHPGAVDTPLFRKGGGIAGLAGAVYGKLKGKPASEGADTVVWLAASTEVAGVSGRFWIDRRERPCRFRDNEAEDALWSLCASMSAA